MKDITSKIERFYDAYNQLMLQFLMEKPITSIYIIMGITFLFIYGLMLFKKNNNLGCFVSLLILFIPFSFVFFFMYPFYYHFRSLFEKKNKSDNFVKVRGSTKNGFTFYTEKGNIYLDNPFRGIYIQGGAGSGKSKSIFEPIIEQMVQKQYSGLLYDFKSPELTRYVYAAFKKVKTNVTPYFIDFKDPLLSHKVNPIYPDYIKNSAYALEFSKALTYNLLPEIIKKQDFWGRNAQNILAGIIWYLKKNYPKYCTLPHVISLCLHTDIEILLERIIEDPEAGGMVVSLKQAMDRGAERQVAGVLSTLQNALSTLNTADIFWILSGQDVDLNLNDMECPRFLCIGNDSTIAETYAPVISLIITVASKLMNKPNKHQSIILLDEAPTLYIPNFEQIPATARSNKIATVFGAQDFSQIIDKYGRDKAQVIISNLGNQFYGRTTNVKSAETIKNIFSKHDRTFWSENKNRGTSGKLVHISSSESSGKSQSIQERDRVKVNQLVNLDSGVFYGIIAEGNTKEFLGVQFKPFRNNDINLDLKNNEVSKLDIEQNYASIVNESKQLFETRKEIKKGLDVKYLDLDI